MADILVGRRRRDHSGAQIDHEHGPASLRGSLHWLCCVDSTEGRAAMVVSVFDMAREQFRFVHGPIINPRQQVTARISDLPGGQLCVSAAIATSTAGTVDMWVLRDYSNDWSWQVARRIHIKNMPQLFHMAQLHLDLAEVVDNGGSRQDQELVLHLNGYVAAYSFRREEWRRTRLLPTC